MKRLQISASAITQCQQWGFQRIVPCFDDMMAKCAYTTTIIADERYTNLITNGDVVEERHSIGGTRQNKICQYGNSDGLIFSFRCWNVLNFKREFEYPDGHKFMLELLVPPNSKRGSRKIVGCFIQLCDLDISIFEQNNMKK